MEQLARETAVFGIHLSQYQLEQFSLYQNLLLDWNQRLNLTAIREPEQIQRRHFLDALTCSTAIAAHSPMDESAAVSMIDVGTGAGFPGLPLKILYPHMRLTLVESIAKKAHFLETAVTELGLSNVTVIAERAEVLGRDDRYREQFDWVMARAVAQMRVLAEYLLPLCRVGGHVLAQKGQNAAAEVEAAANAVRTLGGELAQLHPIKLPQRDEIHYLVVIKKTAVTPAKYPRRTGMPAKRPL